MQVLKSILESPVPQEVQGPAHGIADDIGGETTVKTCQEAFVSSDATSNAEGASKCGGRISINCALSMFSLLTALGRQNFVVGRTL